jgi:hypothetical protein
MAADSGWYAGVSLGQSKVDYNAGQLKSVLVSEPTTPASLRHHKG